MLLRSRDINVNLRYCRVMRIAGYPNLRNAAEIDRVGLSLGEHTGDKLYLLFIHVFFIIITSYNNIN